MQQSENTPASQIAPIDPPTQAVTSANSDPFKGAEGATTDGRTAGQGQEFWWVILPIAVVIVWLLLRSTKKSAHAASTASSAMSRNSGQSAEAQNEQTVDSTAMQSATESRNANKRERTSQTVSESKKLVKQRIREKKKQKLAQAIISAKARAAEESVTAQGVPPAANQSVELSELPGGIESPQSESAVDWQATAAVQAAIRSSQTKKKKQSDKRPAVAAVAGFQKFERPTMQVRQVTLPDNNQWNTAERTQSVIQNEPAKEFQQQSSVSETNTSNPQPRTLKDFIGSRASPSGE